jgi:hypothetical protein
VLTTTHLGTPQNPVCMPAMPYRAQTAYNELHLYPTLPTFMHACEDVDFGYHLLEILIQHQCAHTYTLRNTP